MTRHQARFKDTDLFVACPDFPYEDVNTLTFSMLWWPALRQTGYPLALAGQNGMERWRIPWDASTGCSLVVTPDGNSAHTPRPWHAKPATVKDRATKGHLTSSVYNDKGQRLYAPPAEPTMIACHHCGKQIPERGKNGQWQKYCDQICSMKAYAGRKAAGLVRTRRSSLTPGLDIPSS